MIFAQFLTSEPVWQECRRARSFYTNPERRTGSAADFGISNLLDRSALLYQPYVVVDMKPGSVVHHHALRLVIRQVISKGAKTPADREKIGRILTEFMLPYFNYPVHWVMEEARQSFRGELNNHVVQCKFPNGILSRCLCNNFLG